MRYYSTTAGEMTLQSAVSGSDTVLSVNTTAGLPVAYPYALILDYGTANEEVVDVTAAAGTNLTVTRGADGTIATSHESGSKLRHGVTARDFRESREHEAATTGHGATGAVVGTTNTQTLEKKTFSPSDDSTALTVLERASNTQPVLVQKNSGGTAVMRWLAGAQEWLDGSNVLLRIRHAGYQLTAKSIVDLRVSDDVHAVNATISGSPTGRFIRLMSGATELFYVAATGALKAAGAIFSGNVSVTGNVSATGSVAAGTDLTAATLATTGDAAVGGTLSGPTVASLTSRIAALEANLGSQTTFVASSASKDGKRLHWGQQTATPNGTGYVTVAHGAGFTPTSVVATSIWVNTAVDPDSITSTSFTVRILDTSGSSPAAPTKFSYLCGE